MDLQGERFFLSPSRNLFIFHKLKADPRAAGEEAGQISIYHNSEKSHTLQRVSQSRSVFMTPLKERERERETGAYITVRAVRR